MQKAGCDTYHIVREGKEVPSVIPVHLLDGRYDQKGEEKDGEYSVKLASNNEEYDFILVSVACGKLEGAMQTLRNRNIKGTVSPRAGHRAFRHGERLRSWQGAEDARQLRY